MKWICDFEMFIMLLCKIYRICKFSFYRCNFMGSVCEATMNLQSGFPDFLVVHVIGTRNVKPSEQFKIGYISVF